MKHWNRRMGVKIACFVLAIPLLAALVFGAIGMGYMVQDDFYYETQEEILNRYHYVYFCSFADEMVRLCHTEPYVEATVELPDLYTNPRHTNLRFQVLDHTGHVVCTNLQAGEAVTAFPMTACCQVELYNDHISVIRYVGKDVTNLKEGQYAVLGYVAEELLARDAYYWSTCFIDFGYSMRYAGFYILAAILVLLVFCLLNLTITAGRRPGTKELYPGKWDRLPTDLLLAGMAVLAVLWIALMERLTWSLSDTFSTVLIWLTIVAGAYLLLGLWLCLVSRFKRGQLLKNTLVYKVCCLLWRLIRALPMIWRTALAAGGVLFWSFLIIVEILRRFSAVSSRAGLAIVMLVVQALAVALLMLWFALQLRRLQKAGQALAAGELEHQVDTTGLVGDLKSHGEDLNSIASGMAKAVEARMKSERMKTELITNVSHDIKNPLTSIISYAALIGQEPCDNPRHQEYAQVLERKSQHLKRLLEDLVEVSKAAAGNLEVELVPCEAGVLLEQLSGEFSERCQKADLTLILRQPETPVRICVDSRRIWRVFENLMSNACKYSLPGSRVYLSLEVRGDTAVFTFRNTSREPLDVSPEELLERFVRGDSARSTEGNGLGLSIARSLTQLQGGEMHLGIDGDLFKVTLMFPMV